MFLRQVCASSKVFEILHAYVASEGTKSGQVFTSIQELYSVLGAILLSRIDKSAVKAKARETK